MAGQVEKRPVYDNYEISGCREQDDGAGRYVEPCGDADAQFWTLYGHINGQGIEAIGDFSSREAAEEVYYRITGQPFGSHKEAAAHIRLMHAAPALLEALEPYAIEAINLMEMANGEDNEDVADHIALKSVRAYSQASLRPPGADAVTRQIDRLLNAGYLEDGDDHNKLHPDFAGLNASYLPRVLLPWESLDRSQQEQMLGKYVLWDGFDHPTADRVRESVLAGRPKDEWFSGAGNVHILSTEDSIDADPQAYDHRQWLSEAWHNARSAENRQVRPLTQQLIDCCQLDVWPGNAAVIDFGLDSSSHLGALQFAIREELVTPQELDAAMGKGEMLTEIARRGDNPYRNVVFRTSWDAMRPEPASSPVESSFVAGGKTAARPPHPWPSELAESNRHKQSEKDQGKSSGSEKTNGSDTGHSM